MTWVKMHTALKERSKRRGRRRKEGIGGKWEGEPRVGHVLKRSADQPSE